MISAESLKDRVFRQAFLLQPFCILLQLALWAPDRGFLRAFGEGLRADGVGICQLFGFKDDRFQAPAVAEGFLPDLLHILADGQALQLGEALAGAGRDFLYPVVLSADPRTGGRTFLFRVFFETLGTFFFSCIFPKNIQVLLICKNTIPGRVRRLLKNAAVNQFPYG